MPEDSDCEAAVGRLDRLERAVVRVCGRDETSTEPPQSLVMVGHDACTRSERTREVRSRGWTEPWYFVIRLSRYSRPGRILP